MFRPIKHLPFINKKRIAFLFHYLLAINFLAAQNTVEKCLTTTLVYNPSIQENLEEFTENYIDNYTQLAHSRGQITIPVVVHIVTQGEENGISDEQVHTQITALNRDFNLQNTDLNIVHPDFRDRIANVGFNFCLATITPDGSPTTGITRRNTAADNIATAESTWLYATEEGGQDAWDTEQYLNIWVTQITLGFAGFATNPGQKPPNQDGVVINPRFFGMTELATPPFHLGRVGVHEVGHYFNLRHPWNTDCVDNDFVADTPIQATGYSGCPGIDESSCGSRDITANYMNNSEDACISMFTTGQAMRMQAALIGARSGLLNNNGCEPNSPTVLDDEINVYPNPASYYFCIEVGDSNLEQIPYFIYDSKGAKVEEGAVTPNSLQHFPTYRNGVYFIQFQNGLETPIIKKMVINN